MTDPTTPQVTAVIATCGRPELLRLAVRSIFDQTYEGTIEVVVVFDGIPIDELADLPVPVNRSIRVVQNSRTPGLAGGRNTGIMLATGDIVGFCDDDDSWRPEKVQRQLADWSSFPEAVAHATGIRIRTANGNYAREAPRESGASQFIRSRVTEIHPSSLLYRRLDLLGRVGLVDENLPASYGEDYDLLLRATRFGSVLALPEPLVEVEWNRPSFFAGRWENLAAGLTYILEKFPEFAQSRKGTARIAGQVAFAHAALGARTESRRWAYSALRRDKLQLRAYAALIVSTGLVSPTALLRAVELRGHGL